MKFAYPIIKGSLIVVDGDSVKCVRDLGAGIRHKISIRIDGIDTPEVRIKYQRAAGLLVKAVVEEWVDDFKQEGLEDNFTFWSTEKPKYAGRMIGHLFNNDTTEMPYPLDDLGTYLLHHKLGRAYGGGRREPWTKKELVSISKRAKRILDEG